MKISAELLVFFTLVTSTKSQTHWARYISNQNGAIKLEINNGGLSATNDLAMYSNLTHIDLNNNYLRTIGDIKHLTELTYLSLDCNQIQSLDGIENLTHLTYLSLYSNQIKSIHGLSKLIKLVNLSLDSNQIQSVASLENLTALTILNLHANQIESLQGLANLTQLHVLSLYSNRIRSVESLYKLTQLTNLSLHSNHIQSAQGLENLTLLITFSLHTNAIRSVVALADLTKLPVLDLHSNQIQAVYGLAKLAQLTILYLHANQIACVQGLANLTQLTYLDLSFNQIESIQGIEKLTQLKKLFLDNNRIKSLPFSTFSYLTLLSMDNNAVESIDMAQFAGLSLLEHISMKNNRIREIAENAFNGIHSRNFIDFFDNPYIETISVSSFRGIDYLRFCYKSLTRLKFYTHDHFDVTTMDLSRNKIATVFAFTIKGLFKYLNMRENSIQHFEACSFRYMPNLVEIDLAKNLISEINFHAAFEYNQTSVQRLDFRSNQIKLVSSDFFHRFPNLVHLDLSWNKLPLLRKHDLLNLNRLRHLDLGNNQILTVERGSFHGLASLNDLNLQNNLIYDLDGDLFVKLALLDVLNLSQNKIEFILAEQFSGLISLRVLDLSENLLKTLHTNTFEEVSSSVEILILKSNQIHSYEHFAHNLKRLQLLDLSFNSIRLLNFSLTFVGLNYSLTRLDLSHTNFGNERVDLNSLHNLKSLNLSRTNGGFILSLKFAVNSSIEELDLSFNNLALLPPDFFANLKKLRKLNLKETQLIEIELFQWNPRLEYVDLSNNKLNGSSLGSLQYSKNVSFKLANASLNSFFYLEKTFTSSGIEIHYLDISSNNLSFFAYNFNAFNLRHLDISDNLLDFIFRDQVEIRVLMNFYSSLTFINASKSLSAKIANKIFYFNKQLEYAYFSSNNLLTFPVFCQEPVIYQIYSQCKLRVLHLDLNSLISIQNRNLMDLVNLEYLNLAYNLIEFIENLSFANLVALETLILAHNKLRSFTTPDQMFKSLQSLKYLDLSYNAIECVPAFLFSGLFKLEALDLSCNKIYSLENFALNKLNSLRNLHLNDNNDHLKMNGNFSELNALQNIFISKSILNDESKRVFIDLFRCLNIKASSRNSRPYLKSLSLITPYGSNSALLSYDCDLTLYFIRKNIHFNLKTEDDIFNYFAECSQLVLKHAASINNGVFNRDYKIFTEPFLLFIWLVLFLISCLGVYLCFQNNNSTYLKYLV